MTYAVYTRSHPQDANCRADREQYQRCLAFATHYHLGTKLPHYSDSLKLSPTGDINGIQNLFDDICSGRIKGIIVEDVSLLGETSTRLVRVMDFCAAHQIGILVVRETMPCPKR